MATDFSHGELAPETPISVYEMVAWLLMGAGLLLVLLLHLLPALIAGLGQWEDSVERRGTAGGSSKASVLVQLKTLEQEFSK